MSKLKLQVETLSVESFSPGAAETVEKGTVHAQGQPTRGNDETCQRTCDCVTSYETCLEPCDTILCGPQPTDAVLC